MKLSIVSLTLQSAIYGRTDRNFGRCQESYFWHRTFLDVFFEEGFFEDFGSELLLVKYFGIESNLERLKQQRFGIDFLVMIFPTT